jgi:hypothetical protein
MRYTPYIFSQIHLAVGFHLEDNGVHLCAFEHGGWFSEQQILNLDRVDVVSGLFENLENLSHLRNGNILQVLLRIELKVRGPDSP